MSGHVLIVDQGTTSTRSIVFGPGAALVAIAQEEFPQIFPQPGWVEHDPEWLWRTTLSTARQALSRAGASEREPVIVAGARPSCARFCDRRSRIMRIVFRCDPAIEHELIRPVAARAALPEWLRDAAGHLFRAAWRRHGRPRAILR
jgi:hypothetical protein